MTSIQILIRHSGISARQFWKGLAGKLVVEALPLLVFGALFVWLLSPESVSWLTVGSLSLMVVVSQWWFGQSAKQTFLGAYSITHGLRSQLLTDIRRQPLAALKGKRLGEKMKLLTADLKQFEDIFSHLLADFISAWVVPFAMLLVIGLVDPVLGAVTLGIFVLALGVLMLAESTFSQRAQHHHSMNSEVSSRLLEYVDCLPMLRGFAQSERLAAPLCDKIEQQRAAGLGLEWAGGMGVLIATLITELALVLNLGLASLFLQSDQLTWPECLVVIVASVVCIRPLTRMTVYAALLRYMLNAADRLQALAQLPQQAAKGEAPAGHDIVIDDLYLTIDEQKILSGVNLTIPKGHRIAFVGPSGAGKSSLLDAIAAFHIPSSGSINIGGRSIDEIGTQHWYKLISYVTQDVQLLGGSLRDNLLLAKPEASSEELQQAIEAVGLSALVAGLPKGLDSHIGENGNQLSGGERQRVSIARALLHDAPILLLDEITSALDEATQNEVLASIARLSEGKTVITIAHRLDTVQHADTIYYLEDGKIVDSGAHDTLMAEGGGYQQLWLAGQVA
ncbi:MULTISPECIES: ABC transporter ATP-binding protein [Vibrio]|uniref:ABC transporter ATP-binding protein n=1 Tax=Vibrio neptunius TaxID=170651 RepID=A0ABS3A3Z9_9VIBR|nr:MULTISPECIES: ABC transporter ATP-binding protein [Vibrio]KJY91899.1 ABC transporter ATP-binding protein [Vibrio neptunius]MBN3494293.1 ABC transporter ATP-binding protein [Vibrio neptunius]MBN3516697.1 ABC transporter ATP-binding protein [Vibrio neptunius]MBN3550965.1 ABC transporter ATP-binding protein [Vibrio neptunius]MBN3579118.1 ABC transporter ATP-binding protein [Vibrio neptunius]